MKNPFQRILPTMLLLGALAAVSLPPPAPAESFQITNVLFTASSITSWPTNTVGTNGNPRLTGHAISVANYTEAGFYFSAGISSNSSPGSFPLTLVRSWKDTPPASAADWETTSALTIAPAVTGNAGSPFYWGTNLDKTIIAGANWIGVYTITGGGTNIGLTNVDCGLNKKVIPVRLQ
jgi:hypothetical protein